MRATAHPRAGSGSAIDASVPRAVITLLWSARMIRLNVEQPSLPGIEPTSAVAPQPPVHGRRFVSRAVDLRKPGAPDYVLGASSPERRRLVMQSELLRADARWML